MNNILDPNGKLMSVLGKLADLVFLNFTFVIFSIPFFTIGASISALYECTFSLLRDQEDSFVPRQFFRSFKRHFKRGTCAWLLALIPILFLLMYSQVITGFSGTLARMYKITFFVLVFLFALGFQYVFPMVAFTSQKVSEIWKHVWLVAAAALPWSLLNLTAVVGLPVIVSMVLPSGTCVYLWGFLFFALFIFFSSMIIEKAFKLEDDQAKEQKEKRRNR